MSRRRARRGAAGFGTSHAAHVVVELRADVSPRAHVQRLLLHPDRRPIPTGILGKRIELLDADDRHIVPFQLGAPGEYVDYAASKAALDVLTIGLAREVAAEGIRVNGVRAGIIRTAIHASGGEPGRPDRLGPTLPMQRAGDAIEVARAIVWLLSDDASYTTGSFVDVSGGR